MNRAASPAVRLDHVARFPGDLLAVRDRWQPVLERLPAGEVRGRVPPPDSVLRPTLLLVAAFLQALGHRVTQLEGARFLVAPPSETQARLL